MLIGSLKSGALAACVALFGCATPIDDVTDFAVIIPSRSTSNSEVTSAIQELIRTYPVCPIVRPLRLVGLPSVNLDPLSKVGSSYNDAEPVLDVLVRLGYLTKTALPDLGNTVFKLDRTERGKDTSIIGNDRVCLPAERMLVSVTNVERATKDTGGYWGGYLVVDFTHRLDPQSIWAQEPGLVKLVDGNHPALLAGPIKGRALLSRVWMRSEHPLEGAPHSGALWAVSYDAVHNRWEGGRWVSVNLKLWQPE